MQVTLADNRRLTVASVLKAALSRACDVRFAVAYVTVSGLELLWDQIVSSAQRGHVEFLIALDGRATEPDALQMIMEARQNLATLSLYCYPSLGSRHSYHPKMYLIAAGDETTCVIGSSNLTGGGLERNLEVNVVLHGERRDDPIAEAYETWITLKFAPDRFVPSEEVLALYRQSWGAVRWQPADVSRLRAAFDRCDRPPVSEHDLVGWLGLVYDILPDGEFTNADVYAHEDHFSQRYPGNRNIRAKIRQQLQMLRDMGLLEHLSPGRWRKVAAVDGSD